MRCPKFDFDGLLGEGGLGMAVFSPDGLVGSGGKAHELFVGVLGGTSKEKSSAPLAKATGPLTIIVWRQFNKVVRVDVRLYNSTHENSGQKVRSPSPCINLLEVNTACRAKLSGKAAGLTNARISRVVLDIGRTVTIKALRLE